MPPRRFVTVVLAAGFVAMTVLGAGCASKSTPPVPAPPEPATPASAPQQPPSGSTSSSEGGGDGSGGEQGSTGAGEASAASDTGSGGSGGENPATATGAPPAGVGRTPAEQGSALDSDLDRSLGEFDRMLLKEQAELERQRAEAAADGVDEARSGGGSADAGGSTPTGESTATGEPRDNGSGGVPTPGGTGAPPAGTPDGKDDDIVARQLREAAESEKDPALRARLWEEYRAYKENVRRREVKPAEPEAAPDKKPEADPPPDEGENDPEKAS